MSDHVAGEGGIYSLSASCYEAQVPSGKEYVSRYTLCAVVENSGNVKAVLDMSVE